MRGSAPSTVVAMATTAQKDRNYGLLRGWLVSYIGETMPGYWELVHAVWVPDEMELLAGIKWT